MSNFVQFHERKWRVCLIEYYSKVIPEPEHSDS